MDLVRIIIAILLPPLGVYLQFGFCRLPSTVSSRLFNIL
jgi:uncharacterized membrane protein YqaE (UPF0057 family)